MVGLFNRFLGGLEVYLRAFLKGIWQKAVAVRHALLIGVNGFREVLIT